MDYDYRKLRGRIIEKYGTLQSFAIAMHWSERTLSLKMNGKRYWKQPDIDMAASLLGIQKNEFVTYFFTINVQSN